MTESRQKQVVDRYMEGFRLSDRAEVLDCLDDEIVWDIYGHAHLVGKEAFAARIVNEAFQGNPELTVDRVLEDIPTVSVIGTGAATFKAGGAFRFKFCTIFTFAGDKIGRVESFIVPLPVVDPADGFV